jgi:hypothetical protein
VATSGEFWLVRSFAGPGVGVDDPGPPLPLHPAITANPTMRAKRIRACIPFDIRAHENRDIIKVIQYLKYWNMDLEGFASFFIFFIYLFSKNEMIDPFYISLGRISDILLTGGKKWIENG